MLRTLTAISTALANTAVHGPLIVGASLVSPDATEALARSWARVMLRGLGVELSVEGRENLDPNQSCVYACNHQSHVDPPCCYLALPGHLRFVAKESLFKIPIFGAALRRSGQIPIDRGDATGARDALNANLEALSTRISVVLFPEGTRSETGELGPFKKGAAVLAIRAQVPLVPLAITGSRQILPKGLHAIHGGKVKLRIGKPIPTRGLTLDDRGMLTEKLRGEVARLLTEIQR
jgi:1-acyl-sn-glycerol-3-phosphate acyltransferase